MLGVSDDTVHRWIDHGDLSACRDQSGRMVIEGKDLAEFWRTNGPSVPPNPLGVGSSARNRFVGLVTKVVTDTVVAQADMRCGPFTVVSLMSSEAVRELKLEPGSVAVLSSRPPMSSWKPRGSLVTCSCRTRSIEASRTASAPSATL
jgi:molybdopterin-binding protein